MIINVLNHDLCFSYSVKSCCWSKKETKVHFCWVHLYMYIFHLFTCISKEQDFKKSLDDFRQIREKKQIIKEERLKPWLCLGRTKAKVWGNNSKRETQREREYATTHPQNFQEDMVCLESPELYSHKPLSAGNFSSIGFPKKANQKQTVTRAHMVCILACRLDCACCHWTNLQKRRCWLWSKGE